MRFRLAMTSVAVWCVAGMLVAEYGQAQPACDPTKGISPDTLRATAARLHPELMTPAKRDSAFVVGLVYDVSCRVARHAIGRRVGDLVTVDAAMARLFPRIELGGWSSSGIVNVGGKEPGAPWIVWQVAKPSSSSR